MSVTDKRFDNLTQFEQSRRKLLGDVVKYTEGEALRKGFMRDFHHFLEDIDFGLVRDGEDFYALFTRDMKKAVDFSISWPLATVVSGEEITLLVNPISFLFLTEEEARALIKHEVLHLILDHHTREQALKNRYSRLAINLAMDVAVNQYIKFLPGFCQKLNSVNARLQLDLKYNETLEFYTLEIDRALGRDKKVREKFKKENGIDLNEAHDSWHRGNDFKREVSREKLNNLMNTAIKAGYPEEVTGLLKINGKARLNWSATLRQAMISMPAGKRKTVARRNRRQPNRLDLKGELRDFVPEVIVAIDISASINDEEIKNYLTEILGITKTYGRSIRILECDDTIRADYRIASVAEIRPKPERRGGTAFSPVFEKLKNEGLNQVFLVYFTDGQGELNLSVRPLHKTLWIVTGPKLSLTNPFGQVIYLAKAREEVNHLFGIEAMRELLIEWAK